MKRFEIGKWYRADDCGFDPIKVIRRTPKFLVVESPYGMQWRMLVRSDDDCEWVTDSTVPEKWRCAFTYCSYNETEVE